MAAVAGGEVAAAVAAVIAAQCLATLGPRVTAADAGLLGARAVHAMRADGWHITAQTHTHTAHHQEVSVPIPHRTALRPSAVLRPYDAAILAGLARGQSMAQIAAATGNPISTVRNRQLRLRQRIGARCSAHAVALAYQHGWLHRLQPEAIGSDARLSRRQLETLRLVADGLTIPQIAATLGVSYSSVHTYIGRVYVTLGVSCAPHAVAIAFQRGLLPGACR